MAALTNAASDADASGVGNRRQIAGYERVIRRTHMPTMWSRHGRQAREAVRRG